MTLYVRFTNGDGDHSTFDPDAPRDVFESQLRDVNRVLARVGLRAVTERKNSREQAIAGLRGQLQAAQLRARGGMTWSTHQQNDLEVTVDALVAAVVEAIEEKRGGAL